MMEDRTWIQQYLDKSYEQEFHMVKACQIIKLDKIKTHNMKIRAHYSPVRAIVNISKRQLTTQEKSVLNKGFNISKRQLTTQEKSVLNKGFNFTTTI